MGETHDGRSKSSPQAAGKPGTKPDPVAQDHDREQAVVQGCIPGHDLRHSIEPAGLHVLVLRLEVHVEGVGDFPEVVRAVARRPICETCAIGPGACRCSKGGTSRESHGTSSRKGQPSEKLSIEAFRPPPL